MTKLIFSSSRIRKICAPSCAISSRRPATRSSRRSTAVKVWLRRRPIGPIFVLMDVRMPVLDGYQAARAIKAEPSLATTPIIPVDYLAMKGDGEGARPRLRRLRRRALQSGATATADPQLPRRKDMTLSSGFRSHPRGEDFGSQLRLYGQGRHRCQPRHACCTPVYNGPVTDRPQHKPRARVAVSPHKRRLLRIVSELDC